MQLWFSLFEVHFYCLFIVSNIVYLFINLYLLWSTLNVLRNSSLILLGKSKNENYYIATEGKCEASVWVKYPPKNWLAVGCPAILSPKADICHQTELYKTIWGFRHQAVWRCLPGHYSSLKLKCRLLIAWLCRILHTLSDIYQMTHV